MSFPTLALNAAFPTEEAQHEHFMRQALTLAEHALTSLNETPIACVLVHSRSLRPLAHGTNQTNASLNGCRHAELVALEALLLHGGQGELNEPNEESERDAQGKQAPKHQLLPLLDVYVTVEPCVMCAALLRAYRVRRVVYGCANERFGGVVGAVAGVATGRRQQQRRLDVADDDDVEDPPLWTHGGVLADEAVMLLRRFYVQENWRAPEGLRRRQRELKGLDGVEIAGFGVDDGSGGVGKVARGEDG